MTTTINENKEEVKPFELYQFLDVLWLLIYYNQKYEMRTHTGWDGLPDFVDLNIKELKILAGKKKCHGSQVTSAVNGKKKESGLYTMYLPSLSR